jgi:hypothetical protein
LLVKSVSLTPHVPRISLLSLSFGITLLISLGEMKGWGGEPSHGGCLC